MNNVAYQERLVRLAKRLCMRIGTKPLALVKGPDGWWLVGCRDGDQRFTFVPPAVRRPIEALPYIESWVEKETGT